LVVFSKPIGRTSSKEKKNGGYRQGISELGEGKLLKRVTGILAGLREGSKKRLGGNKEEGLSAGLCES